MAGKGEVLCKEDEECIERELMRETKKTNLLASFSLEIKTVPIGLYFSRSVYNLMESNIWLRTFIDQ